MFENDELNNNEYISSEEAETQTEQITEDSVESEGMAASDMAEENVESEVKVSAERNFYGSFGQNFESAERNNEESEQPRSIGTPGYTFNSEPKKPGVWGKVVKFVGVAAAFGVIAGAAFYGINYAADKLFDTNVFTQEEETTPQIGLVVNKTDNGKPANTMVMDVSHVVEEAMPSAVAVTGKIMQNYMINPFFGGSYGAEAPVSGSGIIIGQNGTELLIVTNAHVIEEVQELKVTFIDGTSADAVVKGAKPSKDLAVITVKLDSLSPETLGNIAIMEIGDSDEVKMGQPVIAIGNALGEGQSSTVGWVSGLDRTIEIENVKYENLIMTDAAINPGNSGGALLNMEGQLIGINSAKYADEDVEGMGYAIPISSVADIINDLMNKEVRQPVAEEDRGYLGVSAGLDIDQTINRDYGWPIGTMITQVMEGGPAAAAGLYKNDVIVGFDGEEITSFEELRDTMQYYSAGETVKVDFYRIINGEYQEMSVEVTLGTKEVIEN